MKNVLIDTGVFIALFNKNDSFHNKALKFINDSKYVHFTTEAVITEVEYIFHKHLEAQLDFLNVISSSNINIVTFSGNEYAFLADLLNKYSDLPMDYADGTVVMACEKIETNLVATVDSDFKIYKYKKKKSFVNLIGPG